MHEWALADAVIEAAVSSLGGKDPSCLRSVTVRVGELQSIDREIFSFALHSLCADRPFGARVFGLEEEKAVFRCSSCGREWTLADCAALGAEEREAIHFLPEAAHAFVRCPGCGSPDYRVEKGRGVSLGDIIIEPERGCPGSADAGREGGTGRAAADRGGGRP